MNGLAALAATAQRGKEMDQRAFKHARKQSQDIETHKLITAKRLTIDSSR